MKRMIALALVMFGCGSNDDAATVECTGSEYCSEDLWLCRPDLANDRCAEQQTSTVIAADGSEHTETLPKASNPEVDCFYVYPTVALVQPPGNVTDFANIEDILVPLRAQGVPFSGVCRMFAPLYHQMTLATYATAQASDHLETGYADVEAAFETYLSTWNGGRDFILLGHSQGSHMLRRLLQRKIETDDALRARMIAAMPIGATGDITVAAGKTTGGTFQKLALCTSREEQGCLVTYDSVAGIVAGSGSAPAGAATELACVNPAAVGSSAVAPFRGSLIPTAKFAGQFGMGQAPDLPTTFVEFDGMFSGACAHGTTGGLNLQVTFTPPSGATLANPINLQTQIMHILDYSFPLRDLMDVAQAKIDARQ